MTEPTLIDGGAGKLAIHELGGEGDKVLLVCHATGFLSQAYRAFAHELSANLRVVGVDMRAHGDSDAPQDPKLFDWNGMADDVLRAVDYIGAAQLHGFGHSMGGAALLGAEREKPGTFQSAMVFEPVVLQGKFPGESKLARAARLRQPTFPSPQHAFERYGSRKPLGLFRADVLHDYVTHGFSQDGHDETVTLKCSPKSESQTFSMAGTIPLGSLSTIELSIAVARSGDGQLVSQLAQPLADQLPNGYLIEFETLTHFGPLQEPVVVANAMRDLISSSTS